jgi:hypothetical protein
LLFFAYSCMTPPSASTTMRGPASLDPGAASVNRHMRVQASAAALLVALLLVQSPPLLADASAATSSGASVDELVGLWTARRWFGPLAPGPLVIQRTGTTYSADMIGRVIPVRVEDRELAFELPGGQGSFRGKLEHGAILGHWVKPATPVSAGQCASLLLLKSDGPNRWSGNVVPCEDEFTFYLLVEKRPDGSLGAALRNPERDYGNWLAVDLLIRDGDVVKLIGKRGGREQVAASGTYDSANEVLSLGFPSRGGTYDFRRDNEESDFYPRGKNPGRYVYHPPLVRDDGWPTGTTHRCSDGIS